MAIWVTDLYKQCYLAGYGDMNLYHATDDNISSKVYGAFNQIVKDAGQRLCEAISASYKVGSNKERPPIKLDDTEKFQCAAAVGITVRIPSHEDQDLDQTGDGI